MSDQSLEQAHAWLAVDLLESGDRAAVDAQMESFVAGAERLRQPLFTWQARIWDAMGALLAGDVGRAEEYAADALAIGAGSVTARDYHAVQIGTVASRVAHGWGALPLPVSDAAHIREHDAIRG